MSDGKQLISRLEGLLLESETIEFVVPQDTGFLILDPDMVARSRRLIGDTADLMSDLTSHYDALSESQPASEEADEDLSGFLQVGAQISAELAAREISNLGFVARSQLLEIGTTLGGAVERQETWQIASQLDTGLRRVAKALVTLETAIREFEGLEPRDRRWVDLADSLETRRLYGQFRRSILRRKVDSGNLRASLKSAANRIAILRDLKIYPFLRIDDRLEIRRLQKRILAWLEGESQTHHEDGERLWQDLVSFARLLTQVNHREELVEHDRRVVTSVYRLLFERGPVPEQIPQQGIDRLEDLLGRDDELDQIILLPGSYRGEDLRTPLERLRETLGKKRAGKLDSRPTRF